MSVLYWTNVLPPRFLMQQAIQCRLAPTLRLRQSVCWAGKFPGFQRMEGAVMHSLTAELAMIYYALQIYLAVRKIASTWRQYQSVRIHVRALCLLHQSFLVLFRPARFRLPSFLSLGCFCRLRYVNGSVLNIRPSSASNFSASTATSSPASSTLRKRYFRVSSSGIHVTEPYLRRIVLRPELFSHLRQVLQSQFLTQNSIPKPRYRVPFSARR